MILGNVQTIAFLFEDRPDQWGLRGDPYLWKAMQAHFSTTPLPADASELADLVAQAFQDLTGYPIATEDHFYLDEFAHGGMSSGHVSPEFWRDTAIPFLCARHAEATEKNEP